MATEAPAKPKYVRKKCEHGKYSFQCVDCGGSGICPHKKMKSSCRECGTGSAFCEHNVYKQHCKECGGISICEHGKRRSRCVDCKGGSICSHGRVKSRCKQCSIEGNASEMCEHHIRREYCKECEGSAICEHGVRKSRCKICVGIEICEHGNYKNYCVTCPNNKNVCEHKKLRSQCVDCNGTKICPHHRRVNICIDCKGSSICKHGIQRYACTTCTPKNACQHCKHISILGSRWAPLCFRCYCVLHPDAEILRAYKLKEHYVRDALKEHFGDTLTMIFDKRVEGGCSGRRPDILIDMGTHCIMIEVDEFRHRNYTCEEKRMVDLYEDIGFRKIVFLRFNPDGYMEHGKRFPSPFRYTPKTAQLATNATEMTRRISQLIILIHQWERNEPVEQITVEHLFYGDLNQIENIPTSVT